jgi:hypothetical protein
MTAISHPNTLRRSLFERVTGRIRGLLWPISWRARVACAQMTWALRLRLRMRLLACGLPLHKEFLVLRCMQGNLTNGLFSEFAVVLGALDHFERWRALYAGFKVDYGDQGYYYDSSKGPNSWEYYFEPVEIGCRDNATILFVTPYQHDLLAAEIEDKGLSRKRCFELLEPHVHVRKHIVEKIDAFVRRNFEGVFVIGIHYRGTDKSLEAPLIPYGEVAAAIREAIDAIKPRRYQLFVATDEQAFIDYINNLFPARSTYRDIFRSLDGEPIHVGRPDNFQSGEDAVVDCLLLSRCDYLIRTASNLGLCATFLNPGMPVKLLEHDR